MIDADYYVVDTYMYEFDNYKYSTFTTEVTFDHYGIFEMYAHTTAHDMHTMPKKEIVVGEGGDYDDVDGDNGYQTEGFDLHFMEPENTIIGEEIELVVHLMMEDDELEGAEVHYEIWNDENSDDTDMIAANETVAGEYAATYTFEEANTYHIHIHVEDDEDLHESAEYKIEVSE